MDVQFVSYTVQGIFLLCIVVIVVVTHNIVIVVVTNNSMCICFQGGLTISIISGQFVIDIIVQVVTMRLLLKMGGYNL